MFRVITREVTPQEIYPTIPTFPVVRDTISRNVLAYLSDYKPFIEKTKEAIPAMNR
jgi:cobalamin biosynthesis Co2+ chelatase CbiK